MQGTNTLACGLYYKPMTIVNDDARIVNKLEASLVDDARVVVVIYDHHMSIVQATGLTLKHQLKTRPFLECGNRKRCVSNLNKLNDQSLEQRLNPF